MNDFGGDKGLIGFRGTQDGLEEVVFLLQRHGPKCLVLLSVVRFLGVGEVERRARVRGR